MPAKTTIITFTVGAEYAALDAAGPPVSVELACPLSNAGVVYFEGDDGDVAWVPGEYHFFKNVALSTIRVKGTVGDKVQIIGGQW